MSKISSSVMLNVAFVSMEILAMVITVLGIIGE